MKIANIDNFLGTGKDFDEYFNKWKISRVMYANIQY